MTTINTKTMRFKTTLRDGNCLFNAVESFLEYEKTEKKIPQKEQQKRARKLRDEVIYYLAKALGAATACSRPVADIGWRPHHEHVGQTGVAIRPNLYIASGISGAIQHLAGVNGSKVIVVIRILVLSKYAIVP